jgi:hypothetical protein
MIGLLYEGLDNNGCALKYLEKYKGTSRTQGALKAKFAWLRTDVISKLSGVAAERQNTNEDAVDFLSPARIFNGGQWYYLYKKTNWTSIKCGVKGNTLRFMLTQNHSTVDSEDWKHAIVEGSCTYFVTMELDPNWEVLGDFDDVSYKGFQLGVKELRTTETDVDGFQMK